MLFPQKSLGVQSYIAELLKGILYTERNQQIMCDAGMPHQLLTLGYVALADDTHPLHPPFRAMFERLAAQALTPRDLRLLISSVLLVVTFSVICCIYMYALSKR